MSIQHPGRAPGTAGRTRSDGGRAAPELVVAVAAEREPLLRYARRMLGGDPDGADLARRAVGHALVRSDRLADGVDPHAFLYQIAYHLAVEGGRHHDAEVSLGGTERLWRDGAYGVDAALVAARSGRQETLEDAVLRLPVHYRNVVVLHDALGWSVDEIAGMLGVAPAAARDRVRRARMMLVSALDGRPDRGSDPDPPLSCADARAWVSRLIDGELELQERAELVSHLEACATCRSLHQALLAVRRALGDAGALGDVGDVGDMGDVGALGDAGDVGDVGALGDADDTGGVDGAGHVGEVGHVDGAAGVCEVSEVVGSSPGGGGPGSSWSRW